MASASLGKLVVLNRFQKGIGLLPMIFYVPLGIVLTVLRCFIFLHALLLFYCLSKISFVKNILLRFMFAVCGLVVTTEGNSLTNQQSLILVANHVTSLDPFILSLVMRYILVMESSTCAGDFTQLCSQVALPGQLNREDSVDVMKKTVRDSLCPVLFFPEGKRSNGSYGLLKFRVLPFQLDTAIQPIGIIAKRCFFNINISTFNSPWWIDLLITFFVPFTVFSIKYLPLTECRETESSEQFSERVQSNLAKNLGVVGTDVTWSDIQEFVKDGLRAKSEETKASSKTQALAGENTHQSLTTEETRQEIEEVTCTDPALNKLLKQVTDVLPHARCQAVLQDLEQTQDVDVTITNILEGRVDIQKKQPAPQPLTSQSQMAASTFKADIFPKSAKARHLSLEERKQAMRAAALKRYKEKYGIP